MLTPYLIYIIAGAALLLVALIVALVWWVICKRKKRRAFEQLMELQCGPVEEQAWPRLTLLVVCHEMPQALERCLPGLLEQDYTDYEVVVVNANGSKPVGEVIERLAGKYDHLRGTFVSADNQIENLTRFSTMLGLRAARTDWVAVTMPGAEPASAEWLKRMARHISDDTDLIIGTGEGSDVQNFCVRKSLLIANDYSMEHIEKSGCSVVYEWSPQACIYQRE